MKTPNGLANWVIRTDLAGYSPFRATKRQSLWRIEWNNFDEKGNQIESQNDGHFEMRYYSMSFVIIIQKQWLVFHFICQSQRLPFILIFDILSAPLKLNYDYDLLIDQDLSLPIKLGAVNKLNASVRRGPRGLNDLLHLQPSIFA